MIVSFQQKWREFYDRKNKELKEEYPSLKDEKTEINYTVIAIMEELKYQKFSNEEVIELLEGKPSIRTMCKFLAYSLVLKGYWFYTVEELEEAVKEEFNEEFTQFELENMVMRRLELEV